MLQNFSTAVPKLRALPAIVAAKYCEGCCICSVDNCVVKICKSKHFVSFSAGREDVYVCCFDSSVKMFGKSHDSSCSQLLIFQLASFSRDESINSNEAALVSRYHESVWWRGSEISDMLKPCSLADGGDWTRWLPCFFLLSTMQYRRAGCTPGSLWLWWRKEVPAPVVRPALYRLRRLPARIMCTQIQRFSSALYVSENKYCFKNGLSLKIRFGMQCWQMGYTIQILGNTKTGRIYVHS